MVPGMSSFGPTRKLIQDEVSVSCKKKNRNCFVSEADIGGDTSLLTGFCFKLDPSNYIYSRSTAELVALVWYGHTAPGNEFTILATYIDQQHIFRKTIKLNCAQEMACDKNNCFGFTTTHGY